jgi:Spy/CpxP family protein refolding chaperone
MFRRTIIITSLIVALAGTAVLAQGLRGKAAARRGLAAQAGQTGQLRDRLAARGLDSRRLEKLQQNLGLSASQMNGLQALEENRLKETETLQQEMQQKRQALRQLLQQPNPNANEVGNATLALKELRGRNREINQRFTSGIKGLLTPDQLQKLPKRLQQR